MFKNPSLLLAVLFYGVIATVAITATSDILKLFLYLILIPFNLGVLNMIKNVMVRKETNMGDFLEGIKLYTGRGVLIVIVTRALTFASGTFAFLLTGFPTGFIIATLILIIVTIELFLLMIYVILICEDVSVSDALNNSIDFTKKHFSLALILLFLSVFMAGYQDVPTPAYGEEIWRYLQVASIPELVQWFIPHRILSVITAIPLYAFLKFLFDFLLFLVYNDKIKKDSPSEY